MAFPFVVLLRRGGRNPVERAHAIVKGQEKRLLENSLFLTMSSEQVKITCSLNIFRRTCVCRHVISVTETLSKGFCIYRRASTLPEGCVSIDLPTVAMVMSLKNEPLAVGRRKAFIFGGSAEVPVNAIR